MSRTEPMPMLCKPCAKHQGKLGRHRDHGCKGYPCECRQCWADWMRHFVPPSMALDFPPEPPEPRRWAHVCGKTSIEVHFPEFVHLCPYCGVIQPVG